MGLGWIRECSGSVWGQHVWLRWEQPLPTASLGRNTAGECDTRAFVLEDVVTLQVPMDTRIMTAFGST